MMKRLVFRSLMMLFTVVGGTFYVLYLTTGKFPFGLSLTELPEMPQVNIPFRDRVVNLEARVEEETEKGAVLGVGKMRVYKWQDDSGRWHYGEKAPEDITGVSSMVISREQNVIAGLHRPPEQPVEKAPASSTRSVDADTGIESPYSPEKIQKLFEDTKNLKEVLDARAAAQEKLLQR